MNCRHCGAEMVTFDVPTTARKAAPGDPAAICPRCLSIGEAGTVDNPPDFSRIVEAFPEGEAGALMAIAVGLLVESLTLNRQTVAELLAVVQDEGVDPWLVLERLDVAPTVQTETDLGRARRQLEQLLDS